MCVKIHIRFSFTCPFKIYLFVCLFALLQIEKKQYWIKRRRCRRVIGDSFTQLNQQALLKNSSKMRGKRPWQAFRSGWDFQGFRTLFSKTNGASETCMYSNSPLKAELTSTEDLFWKEDITFFCFHLETIVSKRCDKALWLFRKVSADRFISGYRTHRQKIQLICHCCYSHQ